VVKELQRKLLIDKTYQKMAVVRLSRAGKTQIALELA
jgi:hypothetical protein